MSGDRATGRERHRMILAALAEVAGDSTRLCAYEDIVVRAWQLFPQEFGLRGYVEKYPDSSDLHKPLYGPLKRDGYVRVQNKKFGLTESGLAVAAELRRPSGSTPGGRLRRDQLAEVDRLHKRPAVQLVVRGQSDELLDSDLYDFYGVTVRTKPADFVGRLTTVDLAIDAAVDVRDPSVDRDRLAAVVLTRDALKAKHAGLIAELSAAGEKSKR